MARRTTLKDIAARAGVGVATVDRVLNGRARVTLETSARVLAAAEELNYHGRKLMRRRVEAMVPEKTLGFILQKEGKWFYRALADNIRNAAAAVACVRCSVEITFVESLSPDDLAEALARMRMRADAIAIVAIDHPTVGAAIAECTAAGVPVFGLLSQLTSPDLAGYVGIDGRKAGRTAGWAMCRLSHGQGEVGILIGSHRYRTQEDRELGFRSYVREFAPEIRLHDSIVYLDDSAVAYEAAAEILSTHPALSGLYHCGGGIEGALQALAEAGREREVFYICHEKSPAAVRGLVDRSVDLVIANPISAIAGAVTQTMAQSLTPRPPQATVCILPFELVTSENV